MASEADHIAVANRNQLTIDYLCADLSVHAPWVAAIGFYKALHVIEAVFVNDSVTFHTSDHGSRFGVLKTTNHYQHIYRHYSKLFRISIIARYLEDDATTVTVFEDYLPAAKVASVALFHHLKQIEESARKRLSNPSSLVSVDSARVVLSG